MLVVGLRVAYSKKLVGEGTFAFEDVAGMRAAVGHAAASDEAQAFTARSRDALQRNLASTLSAYMRIMSILF